MRQTWEIGKKPATGIQVGFVSEHFLLQFCQYTPVYYTPVYYIPVHSIILYSSILQYIPVHYSIFQYTPVHYSAFQYTTVYYSILNYTIFIILLYSTWYDLLCFCLHKNSRIWATMMEPNRMRNISACMRSWPRCFSSIILQGSKNRRCHGKQWSL